MGAILSLFRSFCHFFHHFVTFSIILSLFPSYSLRRVHGGLTLLKHLADWYGRCVLKHCFDCTFLNLTSAHDCTQVRRGATTSRRSVFNGRISAFLFRNPDLQIRNPDFLLTSVIHYKKTGCPPRTLPAQRPGATFRPAAKDLFGCGPIWLGILIWLGDLSPQRNDIDLQRIRSPPSQRAQCCKHVSVWTPVWTHFFGRICAAGSGDGPAFQLRGCSAGRGGAAGACGAEPGGADGGGCYAAVYAAATGGV